MSSVGSFFSYVNDARSHEPELLGISRFTEGLSGRWRQVRISNFPLAGGGANLRLYIYFMSDFYKLCCIKIRSLSVTVK